MTRTRTAEQVANQPTARVLLDALRELGGQAAPAAVGERAGVPTSTRAKWLRELREVNLVAGPKPLAHLTAEGWAAVGRPSPSPAASVELGTAIGAWPSEPHRALLRLALSAVVARFHLRTQRPQRHPGFILAGASGTGKTSLAEFICHVFGVDEVAQIVLLPERTTGEVLGRREHLEGVGLRFTPSPLLAEPLLVFDEFDKAATELQRSALISFHGNTRAVKEQTPLELRAVPMLTCNKRATLPVPPEYRRRSVVLDTDPLVPLLTGLALRLRELQRSGGPPRLALERLAPPTHELPPAAFEVMHATLRDGLTDEGLRMCTLEAVELMALGRAGGVRDADLDEYALTTAVDYLTCAETVGETQEGWRRALYAEGDTEAGRALERGQVEQRQLAQGQTERGTAQKAEALVLTGERAALASRLKDARPDLRSVPRSERERAAAARAQLDRLHREVAQTRSADALAQLRDLAGSPLVDAARIRAVADHERALALQNRERARQATLRDRQERAAAARLERERAYAQKATQTAAANNARRQREAAKAQWRHQLSAITEHARQLERLWHRAPSSAPRPLEVLPDLELDGHPILAFRPESGTGETTLGMRMLGALAAATGQGTWHSSLEPRVCFGGSRHECRALTSWGPGTRAVLEPALRALYVEEDSLREQLSRPRRRRPF